MVPVRQSLGKGMVTVIGEETRRSRKAASHLVRVDAEEVVCHG